MQFSYDSYKNLKQSKLFLKNPQGKSIGLISGVKELKLKAYFNSVSEISFKIYEYENNIKNDLYDLIEDLRLVEMQYVAVFQIQEVNETNGDNIEISYKEVICKTLENELINKYVDNIVGVYSLYSENDVEHSLLHIICNYCSWTIGTVDLELLNMWRTFNIDSSQIYNLLTGEISKSFNCIFQFDTFNKIINCYTLDNIGQLTDIVISNKNVLKQYVKKSNLDKISTKMRVRGGTNTDGTPFDIRSVNPDGTNEIINVNYYKTTEWMSLDLINAINTYQSDYDTYSAQYSSTINTLKQYQLDLDTLNNQLVDLDDQINAQDTTIGISVKYHNGRPPINGESDYTDYQNAINQKNTLSTQRISKENEITNKQNQIDSVLTTLDNISNTLNKSNYFTPVLLKELDSFLTQGDDYSDETFQANSEMSDDKITQLKLELKSNAEAELLKVCRPQYTFETTISNLWTIQDNKDSIISYQVWRSQLVCGNIITLKFRKDYFIQVRLMSIEFDFDDLESVSLTFSDKSRIDDEFTQLGEIIKQADSTSKTISLNYYGIDQASKNTSSLLDFKNGTLNATLNKMQNNEKGEITFDEYGLKSKQVADDGTIGNHQMWLNPYRMIFTDDGWKTANSAFGLLSLPDGSQRMGINTDYLIGKISMTEETYISNSSGNYYFTEDGFNASALVNGNTYGLNINPSTPLDLFSVTVNGTRQLYVDTVNNKLVYTGDITGASGSFSGALNGATGTFSGAVSGGTIDIGNGNFTVEADGTVSIKKGNISIISDSLEANSIYFKYINTIMSLAVDRINFTDMSQGISTTIKYNGLNIYTPTGNPIKLESNGNIKCSTINNSAVVTGSDITALRAWVTANFVAK